jgi:4-hydroxybenzoate polyprenyltransferase
MKTVYLITKSDLKTTVLPATTFALASLLSGPLLTTGPVPNMLRILSHIPKAILWTWMNLWIFNLANQRLPNSVLEDSINKPWRAIPSKRLSERQAGQLLLMSIPIVHLSTFYIGGRDESMALMVLTWVYNDLGAANEYILVRHVNNALGFVFFSAGATQVACGFEHGLNGFSYKWLGVVAAVITFTIQFQDMEDQEGDLLRKRRTMPIVLGDWTTRWINALLIIIFSFLAPAFWKLTVFGFVVPILLGSLIAARSVLLRNLSADKGTFKLWCLWLITLYLLPLFKRYEVLW